MFCCQQIFIISRGTPVWHWQQRQRRSNALIVLITDHLRSLQEGSVFSRVYLSICQQSGPHVITVDLSKLVDLGTPNGSDPAPPAPVQTFLLIANTPIGKRVVVFQLKGLLV